MKQRSARIRARQDADFAKIVGQSGLIVPTDADWSIVLDGVVQHGNQYSSGSDYDRRMRQRVNQIAKVVTALQSRHTIAGRNVDFRHFRRTVSHGFTYPTLPSLQSPYFGVVLHNIMVIRQTVGNLSIAEHAVMSAWSIVADGQGIRVCATIGNERSDIAYLCRSVPEVIRKLSAYVEDL